MGIIHDLKSPLSYVYSMLGFFEMQEEEENNILQEGKSRVKRLADNIERMLSEVKFNNQKNRVLQSESYDIENRCREIADDLQLIYGEKEVSTTFNIAPEASTIRFDPLYFDSCLHNLLDNAIKYSDNTPFIIITAKKEKDGVLISIADNGMGIPKKEQRKVFNDFYRSQQQSSVKGHGIGLSSVQQIVKVHGGKIKLESEEGKGSVFTIIFPNKQ